MASVSGCDGRCCSVFNYSVGIATLRERDDPESTFLADMFIELTPEEAAERSARFGVTPPEGYTMDQWAAYGPLYACRHWDEETRLCTVYDKRPKMCADYPYAKPCQHGCGCSAPQSVIDEYLAYYASRGDDATSER